MAWIESHTVCGRHRKLVAMAADLGIKPVYLLGHLHSLWHAALEQQEDGDLSKWPDAMIASYSQFEGDAGQFVAMLQKHEWMDGKRLHDWLDYAGRFLTSKYAGASRDRLVNIWAKHGREYGQKQTPRGNQEVTNKEPTTPNQPNPPNQPTKPTQPELVGEGLDSEINEFFRISPLMTTRTTKEHEAMVKLVTAVGWDRAKAMIAEVRQDPTIKWPAAVAMTRVGQEQINKARVAAAQYKPVQNWKEGEIPNKPTLQLAPPPKSKRVANG